MGQGRGGQDVWTEKSFLCNLVKPNQSGLDLQDLDKISLCIVPRLIVRKLINVPLWHTNGRHSSSPRLFIQ